MRMLMLLVGWMAAGFTAMSGEDASSERSVRSVASFSSSAKTLTASRGTTVVCTNERPVRFVGRGIAIIIR